MLEARTILVIGATSGIGAAVFRQCRALGADVIGIGRRAELGQALVASCGGRFVQGDITDDAWLAAFFAELAQDGIILDGAVNNAAITQDAIAIDELPVETFDRLYHLNVRATFLCLKHEIAAMRQRGGAVVNVASIAGKRGFAGLAAYTASKHAVVGLTKSAALDGARSGIRVNAVLPGTTRTEMFEQQMKSRPGGEAGTVGGIPLGRVSEPAEQAAMIAWLLSANAGFVTGEALTVDGGATIR